MDFQFKVPICGAVRDRNELKYISALGQTGKDLRSNGTLELDDILAFIKSRHGFVVDREYALKHLRDLNGDPSTISSSDETGDNFGKKDDDFLLDTPMLASLILIPHILRISKEGSEITGSCADGEENEIKESVDILFKGKYDELYSTDEGEDDDSQCIKFTGDIFDQVLSIIRKELRINDDEEPPNLTKELLRELFMAYGETQISDVILEDMIKLCLDSDDVETNDSLTLNKETFQKALTSDLHVYNYCLETNYTFILEDILNMNQSKDTKTADHERSCTSVEQNESTEGSINDRKQTDGESQLKRVFCATSIDLTADTFQSEKYFVVLLWSLIVAYFAYFGGDGYVSAKINCDNARFSFGCRIGVSILDWTFIFAATLLGAIFLVAASGTNVRTEPHRSPVLLAKQIIGLVATAVCFVPPFFNVKLFGEWFVKRDNEALKWAPYVSLSIAIFLLIVQTTQLIQSMYPKTCIGTVECTLKKEHQSKLAIRHKVMKLCDNAIALHRYPKDTASSRHGSQIAKDKFESLETEEDIVGDFWWVYKNLSLLQSEHGIWSSARNMAAHASHILAIFVFIFAHVYLVTFVRDNYQKSNKIPAAFSRSMYFNKTGVYAFRVTDVNNSFLETNNLTFAYDLDEDADLYVESQKFKYLRNVISAFQLAKATDIISDEVILRLRNTLPLAVSNATGLSIERAKYAFNLVTSFQGNFVSFIYEQASKKVTEQEVVNSIIFGTVLGLFVMMIITITYCPSIYMQVLEFRHGAFSAPLVDSNFATLRQVPLNSTHLFGATIWGCLISGASTTVVFGILFFLVIWSETKRYSSIVIALLIGLTVTITIRALFVVYCANKTFSGFYRTQPASANFLCIQLESWNIVLSAGEILGRAIKLLLLALLYLGRLDTPILDSKANSILGFMIDRYTSFFTVDILLHEAHRHPYLDRLGVLCLLKIHHGSDFITKAGSCWRLLFTLALFPWLANCRIKALG